MKQSLITDTHWVAATVLALCCLFALTVTGTTFAQATPQCRDGIDNDGDGLIDAADDFCHTDGLAANPQSYDPNDNDERMPPNPANPMASILLSGPTTTRSGEEYIYTVTLRKRADLISSAFVNLSVAWNANGAANLFSHTTFQSSNFYNCRQIAAGDVPSVVTCDLIAIGGGQAEISFTFRVRVRTTAPCGATIQGIVDLNSTTPNPPTEPVWSNVTRTTVECGQSPQCRDGMDNDGDGATDHPADFSCSAPDDNDETNPRALCQDGADNDGDGLVDFPQDPGCVSRQDNDEFNVVSSSSASSSSSSSSSSSVSSRLPQCRDGVDNDGDGAVDMGDFSCSAPDDDDETNPRAQCQDGTDNDGDGRIDMDDPGCSGRQDNDESNDGSARQLQCEDGRDNDRDGSTDYPADPGCTSRRDDSEEDDSVLRFECNDRRDNDRDGTTDYPDDPGCDSRTDDDEFDDARRYECSDQRDNDRDGLVDHPADPGCENRTDDSEDSDRPVSTGTATINVSKVADRTEAQPGDLLTYTITVRNDGRRAAEDVTVEDVCDAGLTTIVDTGGAQVVGNSLLRWQVGRLEPGAVRTFTYRTRLSPNLRHGDSVTNRVSVRGSFGNVNGSATVRTIERLPQTGGADIGNGSPYLMRIRGERKGGGGGGDGPPWAAGGVLVGMGVAVSGFLLLRRSLR